MVKALLKATPDEVEDIVGVAIGCTVTKDEHLTLNQFKSWDGWERYLRAGITVMDMETGEPANLSQLSADRLLQSN
jgi:hypothetical protein